MGRSDICWVLVSALIVAASVPAYGQRLLTHGKPPVEVEVGVASQRIFVNNQTGQNLAEHPLIISPATTIKFYQGSAGHDVTFIPGEVPAGVNAASISIAKVNSSAPGYPPSVTLTIPGEYHFECAFHVGLGFAMFGSIVVTKAERAPQVVGVTAGVAEQVIFAAAQTGLNVQERPLTFKRGTEVTFLFCVNCRAPHNVRFTEVPAGVNATKLNSPDVVVNNVLRLQSDYTVALVEPGFYRFVCTFHLSTMNATISVQ